MMSTRALVASAAAAAVVAAGLGGYLALRQNAADRQAAVEPQSPRPAVPAAEIGAPVPDRAPAAPEVGSLAPSPDRRRPEPAARPSAPARPVPPTLDVPAPDATTLPPPVASSTAVTPVPVPDPPPPVIDPPRLPEPPRFEELTIKEDSVIGIRLESTVSSETAKVEDRVIARVTRDVTVDGRTAVPSGARLEGIVTLVEPGGKFKERARLGIRFTQLILADSVRVPLQTDVIVRTGDSPAQEAGSKIGASAVVGAILGAVVGGKKGAAIGTAAGAAGGTAVVAASGRHEAVLTTGSLLTVRLTSPVKVLVERY